MKKRLLLPFTTLLLLTGCDFNKHKGLNVEAQISLPLGNISLSDESLFAMAGEFSDGLTVKDGILNFSASDDATLIDNSAMNSILELPVQNITFSLPLLPNSQGATYAPIPPGVERTVFMNLPNSVRIDEIILNSLTVRMNVTSASGDFSRVIVEVPQIIHRETLEPLRMAPNESKVLNSNYIVKPIKEGDKINGLTLVFSGEVNVADIEGEFVVDMSAVESVVGYLGQKQVDTPRVTYETTSDFTQFTNMLDYIYFADPAITIKVTNQYNVPMLVTIDALSINATAVELKPKYNKFFIAPEGTSIYTLSNSSTISQKQISELVGKDFSSFIIDLDAQLNPTVADVNELLDPPVDYEVPTVNSLNASQSVTTQYSMELPFDLVLSNVRFSQQIDVDLSSITEGNTSVTDFAFGFTGVNYMPLEMNLNAYIKRADGTKEMLFENPVLIPASQSVNVVDVIPYIIEGKDMRIVDVKSSLLEELFNNSAVFFEFGASTKGASQNYQLAPLVKVFSPSYIDLKVVVGSRFDIELISK